MRDVTSGEVIQNTNPSEEAVEIALEESTADSDVEDNDRSIESKDVVDAIDESEEYVPPFDVNSLINTTMAKGR